MIRLMAAVRTTLVVAAWLLGVPTVAVAVAGSPIPSRRPSVAQVQIWLQNPLDPVYKAETARALGWIVWGLISIAVLAVLTLHLRATRWTRVIGYLPPPAQSLAAAILGTAVVATSTSPLVTPPAAACAPVSDVKDIELPHAAAATRVGTHPASAVTVSATDARIAQAAIASSAARHGTLTVPAWARAASSGPGHIVVADDVRGRSEDRLVRGHDRQNEQVTANAVPGPGVRSGEPAESGLVARAREAPHVVHRVVKGDNLWDIAARRLGDPHRWPELYKLNRGHRQANGYALTDPDQIDVGWVLALPAHHAAAPSSDPVVTPPPATPTPSPPAKPSTGPIVPSPDASPTVSPSSRQLPGSGTSSSAPGSPDGTISPPVSAVASPATDASPGGPASPASPLPSVSVPGGWITTGLAAGLVAAVTMVWRRRRHRYQPTPITSPHLDDADLLPPLAAMTRIRTTLRRTAPETLDDQPAVAPTVREYQSATVKPELPPIGPTGSDLAGAADLPLSTGLGLTGDGALDAARGLLVATLAAGSNDDPDAKGHAIIPASTLATLLGVSAVDLGHLERLTVTDTDADAITALEEEIIRRSRLIADAQVADVRTLRDTDLHAEPMPQLLLIAELTDPAWTTRLTTAVRLGHSVDIGAAIIGDWPTGTTLTVAADGTTGTDTRLGVLDTTTAIDTLGLLREAHRDSNGPIRTQPPQPHTARTAPEPAQDADHPSASGSEPARHTTPPPATPATAPDPDDGRRPVVVRVLGRPAVLDADGQPSPGIRSKAVELLVYLAVNRNGADLSDIMEALFPDANLRRASERLSTVAADLRKHIRRAAATPTDNTETLRKRLEPIPNTGSRYHIDPTIVAVDWWTVLDHYEAVAATTEPTQQLAHLTAAIDAASGGLAQDAEYDWIDTDREVVRRHRIKLHVHTAALLADTDPHRSWLLLEQACEIDPLSDELARATMRAAATLGDADAIRHRLKTLREALDAHGLDITDDTETLARDLLRQLHPPRTSSRPHPTEHARQLP